MKYEEQQFGENKCFIAHDNSHSILIGERTQIVNDKDEVIYDFQEDGDWKETVLKIIDECEQKIQKRREEISTDRFKVTRKEKELMISNDPKNKRIKVRNFTNGKNYLFSGSA